MPKLKRASSEKKQKYWRQLTRDQRQMSRECSDQAVEFEASAGSAAEQAIAHEIYSDLVEDACLGLCFEVHRAVKCGYFFLDETDPDSMKDFEIVDQPGVDIFGQVYNQWKNKECECPNCSRSIAASRFAPHLEKCLGMGRNSSRIANRRIASSNNLSKSESDQEDNDDINDNDWSYGSEKKAKKRKSDKGSSVETPIYISNNSGINYENLGPEELCSLLTTQCGVISEHTKKMCTRSLRCPQHTDEQRKSVRTYLLGSSASLPDSEVSVENESYDASESQSFMSRLQWDGTSDISPSDSASSKASTNNSDSKKSKKKKPHLGLPSASGLSSNKKKKLKAPALPTASIYDDIN
ncbi:ataxin-7-like protein 3 isoform X2 [Callorhinchus milii]|uniref:ataxin-7-like protein 3 isoform X2 n=1 Tax=Callorhinchus milii TaxID=7868 RepID=UPI001C3F544D|nr:ataxin-7-like protein 3 isoform X2 [Callorhinchus milii]